MKLTLNKTSFVNNLISPVSKIADNILLDFQRESISSDRWIIKTLVTSSDNSVILLGSTSCNAQNPVKCIIPDCKTFLRLFSGIEQEDIVLDIESNAIKYTNHNFSFKYYLLDESYIVNKKSISEEKLNQLSFDTTFYLTKQKLSEIIKFNSIIPDAEKIYFVSENNNILAKIGDEQKTNTNEIVTQISDKFIGKELPEKFPLNIQNILLFSFGNEDITVKINHQLKVFKFETPNLSYIVSGLVK